MCIYIKLELYLLYIRTRCSNPSKPCFCCCFPSPPLFFFFFRRLFRWASGGHQRPRMLPQTPPGAENWSPRAAFGSLWGDFWVPDCIICTLLKHRYLPDFQPNLDLGNTQMPSRKQSLPVFCFWLHSAPPFLVFPGRSGRLEGGNCVPKAPKRVPRVTPKWPKIRQNCTPVPPDVLGGPRGYPPRCLEA